MGPHPHPHSRPHIIPHRSSHNKKHTRHDIAALHDFDLGLQRMTRTRAHTQQPDSPTSSSVTLALEDDEVKRIFASDKPTLPTLTTFTLDSDRTPHPVPYRGNSLPTLSSTFSGSTSLRPHAPPFSPSFSFPSPGFSSTTTADELNPHAKEFIPSIFLTRPPASVSLSAPTTPIATTPTNRTSFPSPVPGPRSRHLLRPVQGQSARVPRWMRTFGRAAAARVPAEQEPLAQVIVAGEAWDSASMAELAQVFAWYGAAAGAAGTGDEIIGDKVDKVGGMNLGEGNGNGNLAALAGVVYQKFWSMKSEDTAETFLWHLKEAVIGTYMSVWDAASNPEAINPTCPSSSSSSRGYVNAAIALGGFIGDLFAHALLSPLNITACLGVVLNNAGAVEHLEAVEVLVSRAGAEYWVGRGEGEEGVWKFCERVKGVGVDNKVVHCIVSQAEGWVERVRQAVVEAEEEEERRREREHKVEEGQYDYDYAYDYDYNYSYDYEYEYPQ